MRAEVGLRAARVGASLLRNTNSSWKAKSFIDPSTLRLRVLAKRPWVLSSASCLDTS